MSNPRIGYDLIIEEIPRRSRVLDLGCGDGTLLTELQEKREVDGYGVEISAEGVSKCLEKGVYCFQGDIDDGLSDYKDNSFDYVIINQTLQDVKRPEFVLDEIMRICLNTSSVTERYSRTCLYFLHIMFHRNCPTGTAR